MGVTPLIGSPWPSTAERLENGEMALAGIAVSELAETYGTPAYVIDEATFRANARAFKAAFGEAFGAAGMEVDVCYASKAFLSAQVAAWAHEEGMHLDTASGGELAVALAGGMPGGHITLHGNNKSRAEIEAAIDAGIGRVVVDSLYEIEFVARVAAERGAVLPVMLRLMTGVHAGAHEFISTAHEDQKFGMSVTPKADGSDSPAMEAALKILASPSLEFQGLHSHIGSQIKEAAGFAAAARGVLTFRAELAKRTGFLCSEIDLGGGYGIAYLPGESVLDPHLVAGELALAIADTCAEFGNAVPRVSLEPGRSIVGPAGITLYTVGTIKPVTVSGDDGNTFVRTYVSVDGGMSDNIRPALYGAKYHVELAGRVSDAEPMLTRIVGKHCESGDIIIQEAYLPSDLRAGDLLAVAATGAYGRTMASNYNLLLRPPVISVSDGTSQTLLRRETVADLLALDGYV